MNVDVDGVLSDSSTLWLWTVVVVPVQVALHLLV